MTLSPRERFILHSMSIMSVDGLVGQINENPKILEKLVPMTKEETAEMVEDIRKGRCRPLSREDVYNLYDEINEEMLLGSEIHRLSLEREEHK
jgi:hypothetical protein